MSRQHARTRWRRGANAVALKLRRALSWRSGPARLPRYSPSKSVDVGGSPEPARSIHVPRVARASEPTAYRPRRPTLGRPAFIGLAFAAVALGIVALVMALTVWQSDDGTAEPPTAPGRFSSGSLTLTTPPGWTRWDAPPLPGLRFSKPIALENRLLGVRLVAGLLPATSQTLLPAGLVERLQSPPTRPDTVRLDSGLRAYDFRGLVAAGIDGPLEVYVLPTTAGIATTICSGDRGVAPSSYDCWKLVKRETLHRAEAVRLGAAAAFSSRLPGLVAAINAVRDQAREPLATRVPAEQARGASMLARTYETAAATLTPLVPASPAWPKATVRELAATGRGYRGGAAALLQADAAAYARARRAVHAHEDRLKGLLDRPAGS
jgi:hypothetical protein